MFQANQQIGVYTLIAPIKRGDFSEVWIARIRDIPTHRHKDIFRIIEVSPVNGQIVILSEYPGGDSLAEKLETQPKFSIEQAIKLTIEILDGLDQLHKKGIIYRYLNPHNIFLQNETPILADFGFSDVSDDEAIQPTSRISYLAPEALTNDRICNVQTEIWSVGVILYQLLSGKLPFSQANLSERVFAILINEFQPLPYQIPTELKEIVQKALAKQPENRYPSTNAMREDLKKALFEIQKPDYMPRKVVLQPSYSELLYPGALIVTGVNPHGAWGVSNKQNFYATSDSTETVIAFYEEKFGKGQVKSDDGAVEWEWEDNFGSLKDYKTVSVYPESARALFTEQHRIEIPANTKAIISIESSHW